MTTFYVLLTVLLTAGLLFGAGYCLALRECRGRGFTGVRCEKGKLYCTELTNPEDASQGYVPIYRVERY